MYDLQTIDDSVHSTGSTIRTTAASSKSFGSSSTRTIPNKKRVRFDERYNQSFANHDRYAEDCHETWYDQDDYDDMRAYNRMLVARLQRQEEPQDKNDAIEILRSTLHLVKSIRHVVDDATTILTPVVSKQLATLYTGSDAALELIGLELHVDKRLKQEARIRREAIQDVVYDIQTEHDRGLFLNNEELQCELRDCCLNYSQALGLFAQLQALAQLAAGDC